MPTNVESSQVLAILVEGMVVEFGKLLCVSFSSSRPAEYRIRKAGLCSVFLALTSDSVEVWEKLLAGR